VTVLAQTNTSENRKKTHSARSVLAPKHTSKRLERTPRLQAHIPTIRDFFDSDLPALATALGRDVDLAVVRVVAFQIGEGEGCRVVEERA
jgi:hypothetical protein